MAYATDPDEVVDLATGWARVTGLGSPDRDVVAKALGAHHVFVEETFDGILRALGAAAA